jgi:predicted esterase/lysophospholipase L1-like esterase
MRILIAILLFCFSLTTTGQTWMSKNVSMTGTSPGYWEYLPAGYNLPENANKKYPVIVFMHGSGANGNNYSQINLVVAEGLPKVINDGNFPTSFTVSSTTYEFIVIAPQVSYSGTVANTNEIITFVKGNYRVDNTRFYLTGLSQGGEVVMKWAAESAGNAQKVAAMPVACPSWYPLIGNAANIGNNDVPMWFYHNTADPIVSVSYTNDWVNYINSYSPSPLAQKTTPTSSSHDAWTALYDPNTDITGSYNIYEWMLQYDRPDQADPNNPYKIVVLGSSTAAGTGAIPADSSWVKRLEKYYQQNDNDYLDTFVYNLGVGGTTTYNAMPLSITPPVGRPYPDPTKNITYGINSFQPKRVIINFPSNDIGFSYPNSETMTNLRAIRDTAALAGAETWILTTQPRDDYNSTQKNLLIVQRDSILTSFSGKAINVFDTLATVDDLNILPLVSFGDGVHVNNTGHRYIFEKVKAGPTITPGVDPHVIPVSQGNVFTMAGYNRVDGYRWFDGDPNTKFVKVDWTADWRAGDLYPNDIWVVLDSVYTLTSYDVYTNYESGLVYSMFFYDASKNQIGDSIAFNSLANGWRSFPVSRSGVRFARLKTYSTFASNTGLRDVRLNGTTTSAAASIFPTPGSNAYTDPGVKAHGMNYLGDRFDKLDLQNDTVVTKITKSVRWYESGNDFDFYPDHYTGRLIDGPLYLGRYTNGGANASEALSAKLRRRGLSPMFSKTGGTIKQATDTNTINNNFIWQGGATAQFKYTEPTANPEIDTAWNPLAEQYYRFITLWGNNPSAVQSGTVTGILPANPTWATKGQNTIDIFETGNEESRWWQQTYYHTPKAYYEQLKKIYTRGKQADSNIPIYAAALPGYDTTYWRAVWWWHYWSGGNVNVFPCDGLNFNMYLNNDKSDQGGSGDTYAISPEKWKVREDMLLLKNFFNRMFPGKQVQWTEFGYATDDFSPYDVNAIGSKTDRQVQSEWTLRLKAIVQSTPFISRMYYYAFFQDWTGPFNSMAAARDSSDYQHVIPEAVGYGLGQEMYIEQWYDWYSTVVTNGDSTGVWVTKKDHLTDSTKKIYKFWRGTDSNSSGNYVITVPGATSAKLYTLRYDRWLPDSTNLGVTSGQFTVPTSEAMSWVEVTAPPEVPSGNIYVSKIQKRIGYLPYRITAFITYEDNSRVEIKETTTGNFPLSNIWKSSEVIEGQNRQVANLRFTNGTLRVIKKKGD